MKWILSIDVLFQFARMISHWNTPDVHAWTFLSQLAALIVLTYFVALYKPKGV